MILGYFDNFGRPKVKAQVDIPSLNVSRDVLFLLDTGATDTSLQLDDASDAIADFTELRERSTWASYRGIGGMVEYRQIPATVVFEDSESSAPISHPIDLLVADATDELMDDPKALELAQKVPSLLGRNIIGLHDMTYSLRLQRLELHH